MTRFWLLLGTLLVAASCGGGALCSNGNPCISVSACTTASNSTVTCGVGMVCCPPVTVGDAG